MTLLLSIIGIIGGVLSLYLAAKLLEVSEITDDPGTFLVSLALALLAGALLLEGFDFLAPSPPERGLHYGWRMHPVLRMMRTYDLSILASSFYLISYVLYFAGIYVSSKCSSLLSLPIVLLLYMDYNALSVIILLISSILTYAKLGSRGISWSLFLLTLGFGHLLSAIGAFSAIPTLFMAGYVVRGLAPIIPFCASRCRS
ncbi:hypothetical protein IPA_02880 [Ignicoccus pacificus DSM 13166]|uniref:Uncharacterized protein n=1 Tax=Ignicoccus pacificus DSM 13166 TaxID=940294 RepID=A0A977PKR1_9CREN|nr:hypothetical protein IPA_02880 [Ignicoccus pacificus DSM 13166]